MPKVTFFLGNSLAMCSAAQAARAGPLHEPRTEVVPHVEVHVHSMEVVDTTVSPLSGSVEEGHVASDKVAYAGDEGLRYLSLSGDEERTWVEERRVDGGEAILLSSEDDERLSQVCLAD